MARGWESKSVEDQQAQAVADTGKQSKQISAEELAARKRVAELGLMKKKLQHDLEAASNPRHREMLEKGIADLDQKIRASQA
jgi:hypothetical protein